MTIRELDRLTAEKIAAGEVIENPASVVKELVENALDAGAGQIEIAVEEGGKKAVTVIDNGTGLEPGELALAFRRFATSKLAALEDLDNITSLGFRGEALPSIAAVARISLTTRRPGAPYGARIQLAGGVVLSQEEIGAPEGTVVEVRDLFFNTPGRLKFLRAAPVELGRITTLVSNLALARPDVAFTLISGSKTVLRTTGDGVLLHVIGAVYGNACTAAMLPLAYAGAQNGSAAGGFITAPHLNRASRRYITVVINGRVVRNSAITGALERGYGTLLPAKRYPVAVLQLQLPPAALDVNVHPAKAEVRFHRPEEVKEMVFRTVRESLQRSLQLPPAFCWRKAAGEKQNSTAQPGVQSFFQERGRSYDVEPVFSVSAAPGRLEQRSGAEDQPAVRSSRLIGQFLNSYLVVEKGEFLLLIDQHAAHERLLFNALAAASPGMKRSVQLTLPLTVELPAALSIRLENMLPLLDETGFKVEPFGDNSYIIRAVPFSVHGGVKEGELHALLEELALSEPLTGERRRLQICKTVACHGAIKAQRPLNRTEMENLLQEWENTADSFYCPHGRPAVISFTREELAKGFLRREKGN